MDSLKEESYKYLRQWKMERWAAADTPMCDRQDLCQLRHCGTERTQHIYGLYDSRVHDIFYVGSTFYPGERFADHVRQADNPYSYKELWIHNILESGSYPLPLLLHTFPSSCDMYTRSVEQDIAEQLRSLGHTALCDFRCNPSRVPKYWNAHNGRARALSDGYASAVLCRLLERIDSIAETARVYTMLREIYGDNGRERR